MLEWLNKSFPLKLGFGNPDMCLGKKLCKTMLHNGVWHWAMNPAKYVHKAESNCADHLSTNYGGKYRMPKKVKNQFKMGYSPELDTIPEFDPDAVLFYLTFIDILRCMIKLWKIDIIMEVSLLSSHVALLREGHLKAAVHIMAQIGRRYISRLVYDPLFQEKNHIVFKECDWSEFLRDVKKAVPVNTLEPQGKGVDICMFLDSDHAGDKVSHRSRSGFLIYIQTALVQWFSKKQSSVETFLC